MPQRHPRGTATRVEARQNSRDPWLALPASPTMNTVSQNLSDSLLVTEKDSRSGDGFCRPTDAGRVARMAWTRIYIRAREKTFTASTIKHGWRNTGLEPSSPIVVLDKHHSIPAPAPSPLYIPHGPASLDPTLLDSSPPDGTGLRQATALFNSELEKPGPLISPVKRFDEQMACVLQTAQSRRPPYKGNSCLIRKRCPI